MQKLIVLALTLSCFSINSLSSTKEIDVAYTFFFEDKFNESTTDIKNGIDLAMEIFNKNNKTGLRLNLKKYPYNKSLNSSILVSKKIKEDGHRFVIGGEYSSEAIIFSRKLGERVFITPTASNPSVTKNSKHAFRACLSDETKVNKLAKFVARHLKPKSVGIVHNISTPYTDYLSKQFYKVFLRTSPNTKLLVRKVTRRNYDYKKIVSDFMANNVDHVIPLSYSSDMRRFLAEAKNSNFHPVYIGGDGWGSNSYVKRTFVDEAKQYAVKFIGYRINYWAGELDRKPLLNFKSRFRKKFNEEANAWNAIGFDTANLLFQAIEKSYPDTSVETVRRNLLSTKTNQLVTTESLSFEEDGSPDKDLHIYKITKDGVNYVRW